MNKPNFATDLQSLPNRRRRVKQMVEDDESGGALPKTQVIDVPPTNKLQSRDLGSRVWAREKTNLNTRIPADMKQLFDDLVWAMSKENKSTGSDKQYIQDAAQEAIGDFLVKHQALLAKYHLL